MRWFRIARVSKRLSPLQLQRRVVAGIKVTSHRIFNLILKLPQILALRCYATIPRRIIPGSDENSRFLGYLDLE